MGDYLLRAIDETGSIRVFVANTTKMVEDARQIHNTTPVATAALGRTLTAASIMGTMLKGEKDTISIQFKGDGPIRTVLAVANSNGDVKGYVGDPSVDLPLNQNGKLDVGRAVGKNGRLVVIRDLGLKEPYIGQSDIVSGEIAEDLAQYFVISEQQPSAVALGVLINRDYTVKSAGGYIIQVLPDIDDAVLGKLENKIATVEPISTLIDKGYSPEDILSHVFNEFNMQIKDKIDISLKCDCSDERIIGALISLGENEIHKIIEEDEKAEVVCHFCNTAYNFDKEQLLDILEKAK